MGENAQFITNLEDKTMARIVAHRPTFAPLPPQGHPLSHLARALDVWRQRRALERLDDAALRDIGLTRADVTEESRRPLWSLPRL
jgi:uncharacterized protein YjiS (DUF1127 family)